MERIATRSLLRRASAPLIVVMSALGPAQPGYGAVIKVTNLNDSGPGSLRQALADANNGDRIEIRDSGTIVLTSGELVVDKEVTIVGSPLNSGRYVISGNNTSRVFHVTSSVGTARIVGVTIRDGLAPEGAGILNEATQQLSISLCNVTKNRATLGGGAGIANSGGGLLTMGTTIVHENVAEIGSGGGIANFSGSLELLSTAVHGNQAGNHGAGIFNDGTLVTTRYSTVNDNGAGANGGGFYNAAGGILALENVTATSNSAAAGGGIFNEPGLGVVAPSKSILGDNTSGADCAGDGLYNSIGYNIDSDGSCQLTAQGDMPNTDPHLAPLGDYGGGTPTPALLPTSPAIDQVPFPFCDEGTDQRGVSLPQGERCEIGSYELGDPCAHMLNASVTSSGTLNLHFTIGSSGPTSWTVTISAQTQSAVLWTVPIPAVDPPFSLDINVPNVPKLGTIGFQSILTTPGPGILCSVFETVDTGSP